MRKTHKESNDKSGRLPNRSHLPSRSRLQQQQSIHSSNASDMRNNDETNLRQHQTNTSEDNQSMLQSGSSSAVLDASDNISDEPISITRTANQKQIRQISINDEVASRQQLLSKDDRRNPINKYRMGTSLFVPTPRVEHTNQKRAAFVQPISEKQTKSTPTKELRTRISITTISDDGSSRATGSCDNSSVQFSVASSSTMMSEHPKPLPTTRNERQQQHHHHHHQLSRPDLTETNVKHMSQPNPGDSATIGQIDDGSVSVASSIYKEIQKEEIEREMMKKLNSSMVGLDPKQSVQKQLTKQTPQKMQDRLHHHSNRQGTLSVPAHHPNSIDRQQQIPSSNSRQPQSQLQNTGTAIINRVTTNPSSPQGTRTQQSATNQTTSRIRDVGKTGVPLPQVKARDVTKSATTNRIVTHSPSSIPMPNPNVLTRKIPDKFSQRPLHPGKHDFAHQNTGISIHQQSHPAAQSNRPPTPPPPPATPPIPSSISPSRIVLLATPLATCYPVPDLKDTPILYEGDQIMTSGYGRSEQKHGQSRAITLSNHKQATAQTTPHKRVRQQDNNITPEKTRSTGARPHKIQTQRQVAAVVAGGISPFRLSQKRQKRTYQFSPDPQDREMHLSRDEALNIKDSKTGVATISGTAGIRSKLAMLHSEDLSLASCRKVTVVVLVTPPHLLLNTVTKLPIKSSTVRVVPVDPNAVTNEAISSIMNMDADANNRHSNDDDDDDDGKQAANVVKFQKDVVDNRLCIFPNVGGDINNSNYNAVQQRSLIHAPLYTIESRNDDTTDGQSSQVDNKSNRSSLEATAKTVNALLTAPPSRDLILVNPEAFGRLIPSHVTVDTARIVAQVSHVPSEDWARNFRFNQVLWPGTSLNIDPMGENAQTPSLPFSSKQPNTTTSTGLNNIVCSMINDVISDHTALSLSQVTGTKSVENVMPQVSNRVVIGVGQADSRFDTLFGQVAKESVARVLSQQPSQMSNQEMMHRYGMIGLSLHRILETLPNDAICTLSILEISSDGVNSEGNLDSDPAMYDLLAPKPFSKSQGTSASRNTSSHATTTGRNRLRIRYSTNDSRDRYGNAIGPVVVGLSEARLDSLKSLGHSLRRAFAASYSRKRKSRRGHVVATLKVYWNCGKDLQKSDINDEDEYCNFGDDEDNDGHENDGKQRGRSGKTVEAANGVAAISTDEGVVYVIDFEGNLKRSTKLSMAKNYTLCQFVDIAPIQIDNSAQSYRHNAAVRKSMWVLGGVLRGLLLNDGGGADATGLMIAYRESALTKVLQRSLMSQESKIVVVGTVSPLSRDYEETIGTLRYINRLLHTSEQALPQSPFEPSLINVNLASPQSQSPAVCADDSVLSQNMEQYMDDKLLRNIVTDPRQRLAKLLHKSLQKSYRKNLNYDELSQKVDPSYVATSYFGPPNEQLKRELERQRLLSRFEQQAAKVDYIAPQSSDEHDDDYTQSNVRENHYEESQDDRAMNVQDGDQGENPLQVSTNMFDTTFWMDVMERGGDNNAIEGDAKKGSLVGRDVFENDDGIALPSPLLTDTGSAMYDNDTGKSSYYFYEPDLLSSMIERRQRLENNRGIGSTLNVKKMNPPGKLATQFDSDVDIDVCVDPEESRQSFMPIRGASTPQPMHWGASMDEEDEEDDDSNADVKHIVDETSHIESDDKANVETMAVDACATRVKYEQTEGDATSSVAESESRSVEIASATVTEPYNCNVDQFLTEPSLLLSSMESENVAQTSCSKIIEQISNSPHDTFQECESAVNEESCQAIRDGFASTRSLCSDSSFDDSEAKSNATRPSEEIHFDSTDSIVPIIRGKNSPYISQASSTGQDEEFNKETDRPISHKANFGESEAKGNKERLLRLVSVVSVAQHTPADNVPENMQQESNATEPTASIGSSDFDGAITLEADLSESQFSQAHGSSHDVFTADVKKDSQLMRMEQNMVPLGSNSYDIDIIDSALASINTLVSNEDNKSSLVNKANDSDNTPENNQNFEDNLLLHRSPRDVELSTDSAIEKPSKTSTEFLFNPGPDEVKVVGILPSLIISSPTVTIPEQQHAFQDENRNLRLVTSVPSSDFQNNNHITSSQSDIEVANHSVLDKHDESVYDSRTFSGSIIQSLENERDDETTATSSPRNDAEEIFSALYENLMSGVAVLPSTDVPRKHDPSHQNSSRVSDDPNDLPFPPQDWASLGSTTTGSTASGDHSPQQNSSRYDTYKEVDPHSPPPGISFPESVQQSGSRGFKSDHASQTDDDASSTTQALADVSSVVYSPKHAKPIDTPVENTKSNSKTSKADGTPLHAKYARRSPSPVDNPVEQLILFSSPKLFTPEMWLDNGDIPHPSTMRKTQVLGQTEWNRLCPVKDKAEGSSVEEYDYSKQNDDDESLPDYAPSTLPGKEVNIDKSMTGRFSSPVSTVTDKGSKDVWDKLDFNDKLDAVDDDTFDTDNLGNQGNVDDEATSQVASDINPSDTRQRRSIEEGVVTSVPSPAQYDSPPIELLKSRSGSGDEEICFYENDEASSSSIDQNVFQFDPQVNKSPTVEMPIAALRMQGTPCAIIEEVKDCNSYLSDTSAETDLIGSEGLYGSRRAERRLSSELRNKVSAQTTITFTTDAMYGNDVTLIPTEEEKELVEAVVNATGERNPSQSPKKIATDDCATPRRISRLKLVNSSESSGISPHYQQLMSFNKRNIENFENFSPESFNRKSNPISPIPNILGPKTPGSNRTESSIVYMSDNLPGRSRERTDSKDKSVLQEIDELQAAVDQINRTNIEVWQSSLNSIGNLRQFQFSQQEVLDQLTSELRRREVECTNLRSELATQASQHALEIKHFEEELAASVAKIERMQHDRKELVKIAEEAIATQSELEQKVIALEQQLASTIVRSVPRAKYDEMTAAKLQLEQNVRTLENDLERHRSRLHDCQGRIESLETTTLNLEEDKKILIKEHEQRLTESDNLRLELDIAQSANENSDVLRTEIFRLNEELQAIRADEVCRQAEVNDVLVEKDSMISRLKKDLSLAKAKLKSLHDQIQSDARASEEEMQNLTDSISRMQNNSLASDAKLRSVVAAADALEQTNLALSGELTNVQHELDLRTTDVENLTRELKSVLAEQELDKSKVSKIENALAEFRAETRSQVEQVVQDRDEAAALLDTTLKENRELSESNTQLHGALIELGQLNDRLNDEIKKAQELIRVIDVENRTNTPGRPERATHQAIPTSDSRRSTNTHRSPLFDRNEPVGEWFDRRLAGRDPIRHVVDNDALAERAEEIAACMALAAKSAREQRNNDSFILQQDMYTLEEAKDVEIDALRGRIRALERRIDTDRLLLLGKDRNFLHKSADHDRRRGYP